MQTIIITQPATQLPIMHKRLTTRLLHRVGTNSIKIPELQAAKQLCLAGKYKSAESYLHRVIDITKHAGAEGEGGQVHVEGVARWAACRYVNGRHAGVNQLIHPLLTSNINLHYYKYLAFLYCANEYSTAQSSPSVAGKQEKAEMGQEIKQAVEMLLSKEQKTQDKQYKQIPCLGYVAVRLNNRSNYKKLLISLVERSPKSEKSNNIRQNISRLVEENISTEIELLHHMSTILENKALKSAEKQLVNSRVNNILKQYQANRAQEVYKALLDIIMSLIGEKHYMSAEGMIGYLKTQKLPLISEHHSQDTKLILNLYRMLVTRANNEEFEIGWAKEEPVLLGNLVAERAIPSKN